MVKNKPFQFLRHTHVNVTVNVMLEIRENQRHQRHPRAKNGLAQRGNTVAIWLGLFVACHLAFKNLVQPKGTDQQNSP